MQRRWSERVQTRSLLWHVLNRKRYMQLRRIRSLTLPGSRIRRAIATAVALHHTWQTQRIVVHGKPLVSCAGKWATINASASPTKSTPWTRHQRLRKKSLHCRAKLPATMSQSTGWRWNVLPTPVQQWMWCRNTYSRMLTGSLLPPICPHTEGSTYAQQVNAASTSNVVRSV